MPQLGTDVPDESTLLAECLARLEEEGFSGVGAVLRDHPEHAHVLLRRILLLARLGLLPEPPAAR